MQQRVPKTSDDLHKRGHLSFGTKDLPSISMVLTLLKGPDGIEELEL